MNRVRETLARRAIGRQVLSSADSYLRNRAQGTVVIAETDDEIGAALVRLVADAVRLGIPTFDGGWHHWRGTRITFTCGSPVEKPAPEIATRLEFVDDGLVMTLAAENTSLDIPLRRDHADDPTYILQTVQHEMSQAVRSLGPVTAIARDPNIMMPASAVERLRDRWAFLSFHQVLSVTARPEDVFQIELQRPTGRFDASGSPIYFGEDSDAPIYRRLVDVLDDDRARARVLWHDYRGLTTGGVEFEQSTSCALDLTFDVTLDWNDANNRALELPQPGQWLCGEAEGTGAQRGMRHWSLCGPEFKLLLDLVRSGTSLTHSEDDLGLLLLTDTSSLGGPDILWAIARLVFFDNVQAFVDASAVAEHYRVASEATRHPAYGRQYGRHRFTVSWDGMQLGVNASRFVHEMSFVLDQPHWWQRFLDLADEQGVPFSHPNMGGLCHACAAQASADGGVRYPYSKFWDREE